MLGVRGSGNSLPGDMNSHTTLNSLLTSIRLTFIARFCARRYFFGPCHPRRNFDRWKLRWRANGRNKLRRWTRNHTHFARPSSVHIMLSRSESSEWPGCSCSTQRRDGRGKIKWCFPEGFPFVSSYHETYAFVFWISLVMMLLSYYSIELNVTSSLAFRVPNRVLILWHFYKS